jgi:hypothetical protein
LAAIVANANSLVKQHFDGETSSQGAVFFCIKVYRQSNSSIYEKEIFYHPYFVLAWYHFIGT